MSKILIIGDCHIGEYPNNKQVEEEIDYAFNQVDNYIGRKSLMYSKFVVGDIIRDATKLNVNTLHKVNTYLKTWFSISGNHDQQGDNFFNPFAPYHSTSKSIVPNTMLNCLDNTHRAYISCTIWGVPFYRNAKDFYSALELLVPSQAANNILLIHQTPNTTPFSENASDTIDINHKMFDKFDLVICGHIHEHKQLNDKFWQIGGLVPFNRNEVGQKYFLEIDTETLEVKPIPLKQKITFSEKKKIENNTKLSKKVTEKAKEFDLQDATEHYAKENEFTDFETQKALETIKKAR